MGKDVLKSSIIAIFHKRTGWGIQTIRNNVSKFKIKECPRSTQNAAAHVLAQAKDFSCAKQLNKEDKSSLPGNISEIIDKYKNRGGSTKDQSKLLKKASKNFKKRAKTASDPLMRDAWNNAEIYPQIYFLENTIRNLILEQFGNDTSWWKKPYVKEDTLEYAERIKNDEKLTPWITPKGTHPIYYITLKHLKKILEMNWPTHFKQLAKDRNEFLVRFTDLLPIRNALAHNVPIGVMEEKEVEISVNKICKIIKSAYHNMK